MHAVKPGFASFMAHPAWKAAVNAPVVAETEEERKAVEEAVKSGAAVPGSIVSAEISQRSER